MNKILIVGLGNPGAQYEGTRHNFGWLVLDGLCSRHNWLTWGVNKNSITLESMNGEDKIILMKPLTMMNSSGEAVGPFAKMNNITPENIIVVHDELDIPLGDVRPKLGGGSAGHRGIKDIIRVLDTEDFHRVRCGIGRPAPERTVLEHVLSGFEQSELELFNQGLDCGISNTISIMRTLSPE